MLARGREIQAVGARVRVKAGLPLLAFLLAVTGFALQSFAAAAAPAGDGPQDKPRAEPRRQAESVKVLRLVKGDRAAVELLPEPLLRYGDAARGAREGMVWAWGTRGRPVAIMEVEDYPERPKASRWINNVVSLADGRIAVEWDDGHQWTSMRPGIVLRTLGAAPAPAEKDADRLLQLKRLAQRFEAREDAGSAQGKIRLRLLPRPILRYSDPEKGLNDGAILAFVYGTNPEVGLIIESWTNDSSSPGWRYGLIRMSGGALAVTLDGKEVWTQQEANPPTASETDTCRFLPARD
jgi:hypothetical protein